MASLIATILFGLAITYLGLQNPGNVTLHIGYYTFSNMPLYLIIVSAVLVGILITAVIHALNRLSLIVTVRSKDKLINDHQSTISQLRQEIHELEVENAQLRRIEDEQSEEEADQSYNQSYPTRFSPSLR